MNASQKAPRRRINLLFSREAVIGIGVTIGALGLMCILLGWAEALRGVAAVSLVWLPLGAVLFLAGGITAALGWSGRLGREGSTGSRPPN